MDEKREGAATDAELERWELTIETVIPSWSASESERSLAIEWSRSILVRIRSDADRITDLTRKGNDLCQALGTIMLAAHAILRDAPETPATADMRALLCSHEKWDTVRS